MAVVISKIPAIHIDLNPHLQDALPGKGPIPAEYVFVGIAPSPSRPPSRRNEPFGSRSYYAVQKVTEGQQVYITNLVKEPWPVKKKLSARIVRKYYPTLLAELEIVRPRRILALSGDVARTLCPGFDELKSDHGTFFWNPELKAWVVPTYHFSAVAREPWLKRLLARDLQRFFTLPDPVTPKYSVISQVPDIPEGARVYIDLEWNHETDNRITMVGMKVKGQSRVKILENPSKGDLLTLRRELTEKNVTVVGHNFVSDLTKLNQWTGKPWMPKVRDTMVTAHVIGEEFLSLKHLTTFYTDRPGSKTFGGTDSLAYNAEDVYSTEAVDEVLTARSHNPFILKVLFPLIPWIARMQWAGVYIDRDRLFELKEWQEKEVTTLSRKLRRVADINWGSPKQVGPVLRKNGVNLRVRTDGGDYAVSEKVLEPLADKYPLVKLLLDYRAAMKYQGFLDSYEEKTTQSHPYLHPTIKMLGTRTGRFSMAEPNLQQVPRVGPIKTLFRSRHRNGRIGLMDLSQAELRIVALLANDQAMAEAIMGEDFHADVASSVYGKKIKDVTSAERKKSKGVTFGVLYGGTPAGLSYNTGAPVEEINKILGILFKRFKKLAEWIKREEHLGLQRGHSETIMGRIRDLAELIYSEGSNSARRKIINTPVQATASDTILIIMLVAARELVKRKLRTRPLFGIHDATMFDIFPGEEDPLIDCIKKGFAAIRSTPLGELPLFDTLPIIGELVIGKTWAHCEKTNEAFKPLKEVQFSSLEGN